MVQLDERLNAITPFMGWHPYRAYGAKWEQKRMLRMAAKTDGTEGALLTVLPEDQTVEAVIVRQTADGEEPRYLVRVTPREVEPGLFYTTLRVFSENHSVSVEIMGIVRDD